MQKLLATSLLAVVLLVTTGCGITTSGGEHTGYVTSAEKTGMLFPTNRIYFKSDVSSSQEEAYCVEDEKIFNELKLKATNKEKVTLLFHDEAVVSPSRCTSELAGIVDGFK